MRSTTTELDFRGNALEVLGITILRAPDAPLRDR
jgi:hypothetical protein